MGLAVGAVAIFPCAAGLCSCLSITTRFDRGSLKMGVSAFRRKKQESPKNLPFENPLFQGFLVGRPRRQNFIQRHYLINSAAGFIPPRASPSATVCAFFVYAFDEAWVTVHFLPFSDVLPCHSVDCQTW